MYRQLVCVGMNGMCVCVSIWIVCFDCELFHVTRLDHDTGNGMCVCGKWMEYLWFCAACLFRVCKWVSSLYSTEPNAARFSQHSVHSLCAHLCVVDAKRVVRLAARIHHRGTFALLHWYVIDIHKAHTLTHTNVHSHAHILSALLASLLESTI